MWSLKAPGSHERIKTESNLSFSQGNARIRIKAKQFLDKSAWPEDKNDRSAGFRLPRSVQKKHLVFFAESRNFFTTSLRIRVKYHAWEECINKTLFQSRKVCVLNFFHHGFEYYKSILLYFRFCNRLKMFL